MSDENKDNSAQGPPKEDEQPKDAPQPPSQQAAPAPPPPPTANAPPAERPYVKSVPCASPKGELTVELTIKSVTSDQFKIIIARTALVKNLKEAIYHLKEIEPDRQMLLYHNRELKDDEASLASYGIIGDGIVHMNVKMLSGKLRTSRFSNADMILFVPVILPQKDQALTPIRTMTHLGAKPSNRSRRRLVVAKPDPNKEVPAADREVERQLIRNRMKNLWQKRGKSRTTILSPSPDHSASSSAGGSRTGSPTKASPASSATTLPSPAGTKSPACVSDAEAESEKPVTDKELGLFFDPFETQEDLQRAKTTWFVPPQNKEELEKIRKEQGKMRCQVCHRKLGVGAQTMLCMCQKVFCDRHRYPKRHRCDVDYKVVEKHRLERENPKLTEGGARKARMN